MPPFWSMRKLPSKLSPFSNAHLDTQVRELMGVSLMLGTMDNVGICYMNLNAIFLWVEGGIRVSPDWPGTQRSAS